ncbi:hypothetical protein K2173_008226 [Erythroxylum novogranatense]|uniref:Uncharacterized protein n=1 Tax=Erythroxylum novogranatense TaxID=1862640 RepID=A0AAV8TUB8_9ROSI|nr:hypothetical protein K2173_008226 [Erythroxylum novogranatense]
MAKKNSNSSSPRSSSSVLEIVFWMLQRDHQAIDILLAEIDIYELFAFKHCKGRRTKLALYEGEEYDESHKVKAIDALKRMENWNLFSDTLNSLGF